MPALRTFAPLAAFLLSSCVAKSSPTSPVEAGFRISPATAELAPLATRSFTAALDGTPVTATWSVREGADGGTVSTAGLYTAPRADGTYHLQALEPSFGSTAEATITVRASLYTYAVVPSSAVLSPLATQTFAAYRNGAAVTATWSVVEGGGGGSISNAGLYTAPATGGTFHVQALDPVMGTTALARVVVTQVPSGFAVTPASVLLPPNGSQTFTAWRDGTPTTATWSVIEGGGGSVGASSGVYTAPATEGTYHVQAAESGTGTTAQATVTVTQGTSTHGMLIPAAHPRLWLVGDRLARARAWLTANPFTPPAGEDTWGGFTETAMHGLLTNNSSGSCTSAINWAMANLSANLPQSSPGVACDPCRWNGEQTIVVYDFCYGFMTPTQRSTFLSHVNRALAFWSQRAWGGPPMYGNNYYWGYLRNELEWAIASYHENTEVVDPAIVPGLPAGTLYREYFLDRVLNDRLSTHFNPSTLAGGDSRGGVPHEQFGYGATTGEYATIPFTTAALLGRDLWRETDFWRELVYAYIYATTPARTIVPGATTFEGLTHGFTLFPANDTEDWHNRYYVPRHHYSPNYMITAANHFGTTVVGQHARQWLSSYVTETTAYLPWRYFQAVDNPVAPPAPFATTLPLDYWASGGGNFFTRNQWGAQATHIWIQGADFQDGTVGHMHADYGTFQIWRSAMESGNLRGRYLSRETVTYVNDVVGWRGTGAVDGATAIGHNSVLIDGASIGPVFTAGTGTVERLETQPGYSYLATSLAPPATAAQVWRREFVFVRALETLVVLDRLQTASASAVKTFLNHCEVAPTLSGNNGATCTLGGSALVMTTLLPAQRTYRAVDDGAAVNDQYRIEVDTAPGTAQSYMLHVLQAKDAAAASLSPAVVDNGASFTVTLDGTTSITFQKGMTSTGGSITIGATTTPFRAGVQSMSVTDAGPAFAP
jgi:hypothetical protein